MENPSKSQELDNQVSTAALKPTKKEPKKIKTAEEYGKWERIRIVFVASFASSTSAVIGSVFAPVLPLIAVDLKADSSLTLLTISLFLLTAGIMPLFWGALSDFYGRKSMLLISTAIFVVSCLAAGFSWDIHSLIGFRVAMALGCSSGMAIGGGIVADTHPPQIRGRAFSFFLVGPFASTMVGPLIGGGLGQAFGWRSTMFFGAVLGFLVLLLIIFWLPETLRPTKKNKKIPKFWASFLFFKKPLVMLTIAPIAISFGGYYTFLITFTFVLQNLFHIGVFTVGSYLVILGFGSLVGTLSGGPASDRIARGKHHSYRLLIVSFSSFVFTCLLIAVGFTYTKSEVYPIALSFFVGFFLCFPTASASAFEVEEASKKGKQAASSVSGLQFALMYILAAVGAQVTLIGEQALTTGYYFLVWAGLNFLAFVAVTVICVMKIIQSKKTQQSPGQGQGAPDLEKAGGVVIQANEKDNENENEDENEDETEDTEGKKEEQEMTEVKSEKEETQKSEEILEKIRSEEFQRQIEAERKEEDRHSNQGSISAEKTEEFSIEKEK